MAYNFNKDTCDKCGITKEAFKQKKSYYFYSLNPAEKSQASFQLGYDGSVLCYDCHKEKQLESLFKQMDARDLARAQKRV